MGVRTVLPRRWGGQYRATERPKMFFTGSGPLQGHKLCTVTFVSPTVVKSKTQTQNILCAKNQSLELLVGLSIQIKDEESQDPPHAAGYTDAPFISKY